MPTYDLDLPVTLSPNITMVPCLLGHQHFVYNIYLSSALIIIHVILIILAVVGNSLIIISVLRDRSLSSAQYLLYMNLAVADLLVGLFVIPCSVVYVVHSCWSLDLLMYRLWVCVEVVCVGVSYMTMCAVAMERYVVIRHPLVSRKWETLPCKVAFIACAWAVPTLTWTPTVFSYNVDMDANHQSFHLRLPVLFSYIQVTILQHFLCIIMVTVYGVLYWELKKRFNHLEHSSPGIYSTSHSDHPRWQPTGRRHQRAVRMLGVIMLAFLVCWLPWMLVWPVHTTRQASVPDWAVKLCLTLAHANSALNPFIYTLISTNFRAAVFSLVTCRQPSTSGVVRNSLGPTNEN